VRSGTSFLYHERTIDEVEAVSIPRKLPSEGFTVVTLQCGIHAARHEPGYHESGLVVAGFPNATLA